MQKHAVLATLELRQGPVAISRMHEEQLKQDDRRGQARPELCATSATTRPSLPHGHAPLPWGRQRGVMANDDADGARLGDPESP
jgi:hypothetical protein